MYFASSNSWTARSFWTRSMKKRIGSSNIARRRSSLKVGEPRAIDAVVLLEPAEVEPVAAKLGRQAADRGRRAACAWPRPRALRGGAARRRPHGPAVCRRACSTRGSSSGGWPGRNPTAAGCVPGSRQVDPVAKVRRQEHADDRVAHGVFVTEPVRLRAASDKTRRCDRARPVESGRR